MDYFDNVNPNPYVIPDEPLAALIGVRTIFYTAPVVILPDRNRCSCKPWKKATPFSI